MSVAAVRVCKLIALFAFFLPWVAFSCSGNEMGQMTGIDMALGHLAIRNPINGEIESNELGINILIGIAFFSTLIGFCVTFDQGKNGAIAGFIPALVALATAFFGMTAFKEAPQREAARRERGESSSSGTAQFDAAALAIIKIEEKAGYWIALAALAGAAGFSLVGLSGDGGPAGPSRASSTLRRREDDVEDWDRIANKDDPDQLQEYLLRHPRGRLAELARMKLGRMGVAPLPHQPSPAQEQGQLDGQTSREEAPGEPREFKPSDDPPPRRGPPIAAMVVLAIVVLGAAAFGGYSYLSHIGAREEAATSASDPNAYEVVPYTASAILVAKEDGLHIRAIPFARPDILVLRDTIAGEVLSVVGIANQSDGPWYQVRLADGQMGFFKASLAVPQAEFLQSISGDSASIPAGEVTQALPPMTSSYLATISISQRGDDAFEVTLEAERHDTTTRALLRGNEWLLEGEQEGDVFRLSRLTGRSSNGSAGRNVVELGESYRWQTVDWNRVNTPRQVVFMPLAHGAQFFVYSHPNGLWAQPANEAARDSVATHR